MVLLYFYSGLGTRYIAPGSSPGEADRRLFAEASAHNLLLFSVPLYLRSHQKIPEKIKIGKRNLVLNGLTKRSASDYITNSASFGAS